MLSYISRKILVKSLFIVFGISLSSYNNLIARSLFLNGTDISSIRHHVLENVTIKINGNGDIFIEAPHYQINEESSYMPLSKESPFRKPITHIPAGTPPTNRMDPSSTNKAIPKEGIKSPSFEKQTDNTEQGTPIPTPQQ